MTDREFMCASCRLVVTVASSDGKRPPPDGCSSSHGRHNWVERH